MHPCSACLALSSGGRYTMAALVNVSGGDSLVHILDSFRTFARFSFAPATRLFSSALTHSSAQNASSPGST